MSTDDGVSLADHQNQVWSNSRTNIEDTLNVPVFYGVQRSSNAPFRWTLDPSAVNPHYLRWSSAEP